MSLQGHLETHQERMLRQVWRVRLRSCASTLVGPQVVAILRLREGSPHQTLLNFRTSIYLDVIRSGNTDMSRS